MNMKLVYLSAVAFAAAAFAAFSAAPRALAGEAGLADEAPRLSVSAAVSGTSTSRAGVSATTPKAASALPAVVPTPFKIGVSFPVTINIDSVYARNAPRWNAGLVNRLLKHHAYPAVGRDANTEWVLIQDATSRQWVHKDMARIDNGLDSLPIADKAFSPGYLVGAKALGAGNVSARARSLYLAAVRAGRSPYLATVVGDCNSEPMVFFGRFANGGTSLSASGYGSLQSTANRWAKSFSRSSVATHGSFSSGTAMDPTWADARACNAGENPVQCELRRSNASVVFLSLGTGDQFSWQSFEGNYRRLIDFAIGQNVLPVLVTKADELELYQGGAPKGFINDVIRRLGAEYQLPVMDFGLATRGLPKQGLVNEVLETTGGLKDMGDARFHLSDAGMNMRIVLALQMLKKIAG